MILDFFKCLILCYTSGFIFILLQKLLTGLPRALLFSRSIVICYDQIIYFTLSLWLYSSHNLNRKEFQFRDFGMEQFGQNLEYLPKRRYRKGNTLFY